MLVSIRLFNIICARELYPLIVTHTVMSRLDAGDFQAYRHYLTSKTLARVPGGLDVVKFIAAKSN